MKITPKELNELVKEVIKERLSESTAFSAKRTIIDAAQGLSRQFENELIKSLNLQSPDEMTPELQRKYLEIAEKMREQFVNAAMEATRELVKFPRNEKGE